MALAKQGRDLCVTGRSAQNLATLKAEIEAMGTTCHTFVCDHADLAASVACFTEIGRNHPIGLVVNNAWGRYADMHVDGVYIWEKKFWEQPDFRWGSKIDLGVRTAFLAAKYCVGPMLEARNGAIVNISFWAAKIYMQNIIYGISKAAIDKMSHDMAHELKEYGIPVISLYPGLVRTESVMENAGYFNLSNSESTEFAGMVIGGFLAYPKRLEKSGGVFTSAELAAEYLIMDIDGKRILDNRLD